MLLDLLLALQSISGCGTVAISKAEAASPTQLESRAACFAKAETIAGGAKQARLDRIPANDWTTIPAPIPSNFNTAAELVKIPQHKDRDGEPDPQGAFRFICGPAHISYDDPIVYPKQPGASHLHQFFGNDAVDANSTYASLRTTGNSTCMSPLNRSAYWMPAMMSGKGQVVRPDYVSIYYKRYPKDSPHCTREGKACVSLARGLRFIFGYDMLTGKAPTGGSYYYCLGDTARPGIYPNMVEAAKACPAGNQLVAAIHAPSCWDGLNLDSANHRDHVAYPAFDDTGTLRCPRTHAYVIPHFSMQVAYTTDASTPDWFLSSDRMPGMAPHTPGTTFHSDWWGAWSQETQDTWEANCIDRLLNCAGGDLGNGTMMKMFAGFRWQAEPRLVPVPGRN